MQVQEGGEKRRGQGHVYTVVDSAAQDKSKMLSRFIQNDLILQEKPACVFYF